MTTDRFDEILSAYFDGETTPAESAELERLLESSYETRQRLEEVGEISTLLASIPAVAAPDELAPSVMKRLERESLLPATAPSRAPAARGARGVNRFLLATSVLATSAALLLAVYVLNQPVEPGLAPAGAAARPRGGDLARKSASEPPQRSAADVPEAIAAGEADEAGGVAAPQSEAVNPTAGGLASFGGSALNGSRLRDVEIGEVVPYFAVLDGNRRVAVIEVTVVDVRRAVGMTQVLLEKNQIPRVEEAAEEQEKAAGSGELFAVYVESTEAQLARSMEELRREGILSELKLKPPVALERLPDIRRELLAAKRRTESGKKALKSSAAEDAANETAPQTYQKLVTVTPESLAGRSAPAAGGRARFSAAKAPADASRPARGVEDQAAGAAPVRVILVFQETPPVAAPRPE